MTPTLGRAYARGKGARARENNPQPERAGAVFPREKSNPQPEDVGQLRHAEIGVHFSSRSSNVAPKTGTPP
jgi:hypothetical protein